MARQIGMLHPTDDIPLVPDTVTTMIMTGSSGQASDWFTSTGAAANAAAAGIGIVRVTAFTTGGVNLPIGFNPASTGAVTPTSGTSASSASTIQTPGAARFYQVPGDSTGYSIFAGGAGIAVVEHWRK